MTVLTLVVSFIGFMIFVAIARISDKIEELTTELRRHRPKEEPFEYKALYDNGETYIFKTK